MAPTTDRPSRATLIYDDKPRDFEGAIAGDGALWLECGELKRLTGWELKPEGACLGELCIPIPHGREKEFAAEDDRKSYFNFVALADAMNRPWAADLKHRVWYFSAEPAARAGALWTLKAPDFTLPDLDGRLHSLSDYRGKKVFLLAWASW